MAEPVELGYDDFGNGEVALLVHGFPLDRTIWSDQLTGLSDLRRVVAVDLRGRGLSSNARASSWSIDDHAEDLAKTAVALGGSKIDLVAHSMAGYIAFALWRNHPELLRSLTLVSTKATADNDEAKKGREAASATAREKGTLALYPGLSEKLYATGTPKEVLEAGRAIFERIPGETSAIDALAMRDRVDSTPDLGAITIPVLVVQGESDAIMPMEAAKQMVDGIPNAKLATIPGAGHMSPMENPKALNDAIRKFLVAL